MQRGYNLFENRKTQLRVWVMIFSKLTIIFFRPVQNRIPAASGIIKS